MSKVRSTKRSVEQQKKERAARKRERRAEGREGVDSPPSTVTPVAVSGQSMTEQDVLSRLGELQARFEADELDFAEYEHAKDELIAMLGRD